MAGLLVVDDEPGIRRSLKKVLESEGYAIILAENGNQAIDIVSGNGDDIETVICDYRMPGLDGLSTLIAIGKINPEITRIILTGYATMETAIEAVNVGIDGFLTKPFNNAELKSKVREYAIKKRLKQFISEQILQVLYQGRGQIRPKRHNVSVLFSDIRGFSDLARRMEPERLADLMNRYYFSPLDKVIVSYNGLLDKHIGDGIMAVFGAPLETPDHAERAVSCALAMMEEIKKTNQDLKAQLQKIDVGIGISSGEIISGFYGSAHKKEYTVIGQPVNWASRLEQHAKGGQILVCEKTWEKIRGSFSFEEVNPVTIPDGGGFLTAYSL